MLEFTAYSQAFISEQQQEQPQKAEANQQEEKPHSENAKMSNSSVLERGAICFGQKKKISV